MYHTVLCTLINAPLLPPTIPPIQLLLSINHFFYFSIILVRKNNELLYFG